MPRKPNAKKKRAKNTKCKENQIWSKPNAKKTKCEENQMPRKPNAKKTKCGEKQIRRKPNVMSSVLLIHSSFSLSSHCIHWESLSVAHILHICVSLLSKVFNQIWYGVFVTAGACDTVIYKIYSKNWWNLLKKHCQNNSDNQWKLLKELMKTSQKMIKSTQAICGNHSDNFWKLLKKIVKTVQKNCEN